MFLTLERQAGRILPMHYCDDKSFNDVVRMTYFVTSVDASQRYMRRENFANAAVADIAA